MNLIIAVNRDNAIGIGNQLLEHIPEDLARFKQLTTNQIVVMGWNTFTSLNRISGLPNRENYVLTRKSAEEWEQLQQQGIVGDNIKRITNWDEIVTLDRESRNQVFIIGGAELYNHAISKGLVDVIYVTQINQLDKNYGVPNPNLVRIEHDLFNFDNFSRVQEENDIAIWWCNETIEEKLYQNSLVCGFCSHFVHNPETDWRNPSTPNGSAYRFVEYSRLY